MIPIDERRKKILPSEFVLPKERAKFYVDKASEYVNLIYELSRELGRDRKEARVVMDTLVNLSWYKHEAIVEKLEAAFDEKKDDSHD